ncbi:MAG: ABC transporter permease [Clostridia bacterium]|nr:ABC transporter permease [Clostridia bacterium]
MMNIRRRPMQSFLTILQVALAVACMVSVASYRMNVSAAVDQFRASTEDTVIVMGGTETRTRNGYMRTMYNIFDDNDIAELTAETSLVEAVTPYMDSWGVQAEVNGTLYQLSAGAGVGPGYRLAADLNMTEGDSITTADLEARARVVVISEALGRILFGDRPYVGRTLGLVPDWARPSSAGEQNAAPPVSPTEYRVIGVYDVRPGDPGSGWRRGAASIMWPVTADPNSIHDASSGWARATGGRPYGTLMIKAVPGKAAAVRDRITAMVSGRPHPDSSSGGGGMFVEGGSVEMDVDGPVAANGSDAGTDAGSSMNAEGSGASVIFESARDVERMVGSSMTTTMLLLGGATLVAIIVSALGVQSVMLINVAERTREIGLRRVLGASRRSVVSQFTVDSAVLAAIGGVFGGLLAFALYPYLMRSVFSRMGPGGILSVSARPAGWAVLAGIVVSAAAGAVFGAMPAAQATRVQPAEIIRDL